MSLQSPRNSDGELAPTADDLLASSIASTWLKSALQTALARDPVDVARDAELLALVLSARADALLAADMARLGISAPRAPGRE